MKSGAKLRVVLADDNADCLQVLVAIASEQYEVVAAAPDGMSALAAIRTLRPHVAVLDFEMPYRTGVEVVRELANDLHKPAVIICSVNSSEELITAARDAGALGFVSKQCTARDLIPALRAVSRKRAFFTSQKGAVKPRLTKAKTRPLKPSDFRRAS